MADKIKLADRTHPKYDDNIDKWELYRSSVDGGDDFINDENLFTHRLEEDTDFQSRLDRAYYINLCDLIPNMYNTFIFKEKIERPYDTFLEDFRNNCDGKDTSITDFIKRAGFFSKVYGVIHVLIDLPSTDKQKMTKREAREKRIAPYCSLIYPTQLKDWSVDKDGNWNWVLLESTHYNDLDPRKEREEIKLYKLYTKEGWEIQDEYGSLMKFDDGRPNKGKTDLGIVPLVTLYNKNFDDDKIGKSLLRDIVYINRTVMNWCSCLDEQIERQTFSQLVVPDDGSLAEESETGSDPLLKIGTSYIWTFNAQSSYPPQFISPDVENLQVIWQITIDHMKEIFRLAGLVGTSEDTYAGRSGRVAQMGFVSVNSVLSDTAYSYGQLENAISKIVYRLSGKSTSEYEDVKYPTTFDLNELANEIDSFLKVMERNFSTTLNKSIQKTIARRATPLAPQSIRDTIEQEIDSSDGIVEPLKGSSIAENGTSTEDAGDGNPNATRLRNTFRTKKDVDVEDIGHRKED